MLYGDWGTSRFYVLGLAFYFALYASFWYILGVGLLVAAVGWAYTVVCRVYPDGGGVYSAARQLSPVLSVIGALLLFADYAVTAALSAFEGIHYFGIESNHWVQVGAIGSILFLGLINYIGPKRAGAFALVVALATLVCTLILVAFSIPHLQAGWSHIASPQGAMTHRWSTLVNVVLALSGVEAIANMTGIRVQPVSSTSKKSIWPVLAEVVIFNILLGIAMLALPAALQTASSDPAEFTKPAYVYDRQRAEFQDNNPGYKSDPVLKARFDALPEKSRNEERMQKVVLRVMGEQFVHPWFGAISSVVFGLLLISAVKTVIGGMVSVSYVMSRDTELPRFFGKLNLFGVPWLGLIPAIIVPCLLLLLFTDLDALADLYAIGVVGAIAINLTCCTINRRLPVKKWERTAIGFIAAVMIAIELTLAVQKWHALVFVSIILVIGLGMRLFTKWYLPARARMGLPPTPETLTTGRYRGAETHIERPAPAVAAEGKISVSMFGTPAEQLDMSKPHVLVAARGSKPLLDFAATYAKQINGILFVIFVRQVNVAFEMGARAPTLDEDPAARNVFEMAAQACRDANVPLIPIYAVSGDVAYSILDFAATYDVRALLMGVSRKGTFLRALQGDVLTAVADQLPADIPLLIHA